MAAGYGGAWGKYALPYSVSRWQVDRWWDMQGPRFRGRVLDVGGSKRRRFGRFVVPGDAVEVVNPDPEEGADYVLPMECLPGHGRYDVIRMSEILEHVQEPLVLLRAARRLLTVEGDLLITVPMIYRVHAAEDYGRWTPARLVLEVEQAGFHVESLWALGAVGSVLVDIAKQALGFTPRWLRWCAQPALAAAQWLLVDVLERRWSPAGPAYLWTTGWGVHARRAA